MFPGDFRCYSVSSRAKYVGEAENVGVNANSSAA